MPSEEQGYFLVTVFTSSGSVRQSYGPFLCTIAPYNGELQFANPKANQVVVADMRMTCPIDSQVRARAIVTNVTNGDQFSVVQAQHYPERIIAYVVRRDAQA